MQRTDFTFPSSDGKTSIHVIKWMPDGEAKAVLQILHGMVEYAGRYDAFAAFMAENGYIVVANDHLGHGASVVSDEDHGYFGKDGNKHVVRDIHILRQLTQEKYPDLPYTMLGHSMGSFLLRQYIVESERSLGISSSDDALSKGLAGVIVMGTGWQSGPVIALGKRIASMGMKLKGERANNNILDVFTFGKVNKRISNLRTKNDWLSKDEAIVDKYNSDPWDSFRFTNNAYYYMLEGVGVAHDTEKMAKIPEGLPLLITSGAEDPIGNYGEGVRKTYVVYTENSKSDTDIKLYIGDRHEILNETDRDQVFADMLEFLNESLEKAASR